MKLTKTVVKGGCAAKAAAHELKKILSQVQFPAKHPNLLVAGEHFDDAAVYKISETQSLVTTLDFFTPIVDTPYLFGQIASANALSDIYAMGGKPLTALAILAYPVATFEHTVVAQVLQGAVDIIKKADVDLAGGHTIDDDTIKFGLSVTGIVNNNAIMSNDKAKPGDALILTKGLGTGTLMAALKNDYLSEEQLSDALTSMCTLNDYQTCLSDFDLNHIHALTDVTGFGLAGHGLQMAKASQVTLNISRSALPLLDHMAIALENKFLTKAHRTNREYTAESSFIDPKLTDLDKLIFYDPQTSGGLLMSVAADKADDLVTKLKKTFPKTAQIGKVSNLSDKHLNFVGI